jgi:hypothetical protein
MKGHGLGILWKPENGNTGLERAGVSPILSRELIKALIGKWTGDVGVTTTRLNVALADGITSSGDVSLVIDQGIEGNWVQGERVAVVRKETLISRTKTGYNGTVVIGGGGRSINLKLSRHNTSPGGQGLEGLEGSRRKLLDHTVVVGGSGGGGGQERMPGTRMDDYGG